MADSTIPALPTVASLDGDEWLVVEDDPAGTPLTSKTTVNSLRTIAHSATTGRTATDHHTNANDPSAGEKAALPGTSGTPGAGNKFVTDADARNTNARTPSAHATSHGSGGTDPVKLGNTYIAAGAMLAAITSGATGPTQIERPTNGQNMAVFDFPDALTRYAQFSHDMPSDYNGGTFTVEFEWTNANANTQVARWQAEARAYADGQTIDQAWGTAVAVDDANQSTAYQFLRSAATGAVTPSGSPAGGCRMIFRIARLGAHANDTLVSDARLLGVRVVYTRT